MTRPPSIARFETVYLASVVLGLIEGALNWSTGLEQMQLASPQFANAMPAMLTVSVLVSIGISLLLWYFAARRASVVAKWIIVIFFALSLISFLASVARGSAFSVTLVLTLISLVLRGYAVWQLFQPDARTWFGEGQGEGPLA